MDSKAEDRILFNNYTETNKRLKFDNMSSCSLLLSKSGASTSLKDQVRLKFQTKKGENLREITN